MRDGRRYLTLAVDHILPVGHAGSHHVQVLRILDLGSSSVGLGRSTHLVVADLAGRLADSFLGRNRHVVAVDRIDLDLAGRIDLAGPGPGRSPGCIDRKDPTF